MQVKTLDLGVRDRGCFGGVDVGLEWHFPCVVDLKRHVLEYPHTPLRQAECVLWLREKGVGLVALCAPAALSNGAAARIGLAGSAPPSRRVAEHRLCISGCYATPERADELTGARAWMASGMALYRALASALDWSVDLGGTDGQIIETNGSLAFRALLGHDGSADDKLRLDPRGLLPSKHTKVGKRARIELLRMALGELAIESDPGLDRWTRRTDWADATMAALMAAWRAKNLEHMVQVGEPSEGAITLRLENWADRMQPFAWLSRKTAGATEPEGAHGESQKASASSRRSRPANSGWLLRLEGTRSGGSTEREMVDVLAGEIAVHGETWMPLKVRSVTVSGVVKAIESGSCQLALSFDARVKALVDVLELRSSEGTELGWQELTGHEDNPWFLEGQPLPSCGSWLRVTHVRELDLGPESFETGRKDNAWGAGFPQSASALVRWREKSA